MRGVTQDDPYPGRGRIAYTSAFIEGPPRIRAGHGTRHATALHAAGYAEEDGMSVQIIHQVLALPERSRSSCRAVLVSQSPAPRHPHCPREWVEIRIRPVRAVEEPGRHHPVE